MYDHNLSKEMAPISNKRIMKGVAEIKIKQNATGSVDSMNLTKNEGKEEGEKEKPVNLLQNK